VHSHGYKGNILLGIIPKPWRKIPTICTVHGYTKQKGLSKLAIYQWLDRYFLNHLDAVVLVSEGMRHQVNEKKLNRKLHIIPNGIPENTFTSEDSPIPYFRQEDFKIAAIGRLSHEKNFQLLINAMPSVLGKIPNAKLVIYGEGPEKEILEQLIKKLNLAKNVFLPGYIGNPSKVYRQADLFVNCSTTEGMPITLLESMREGCVYIASNIPANISITPKTLINNIVFSLNEKSISTIIHKIKNTDKDDVDKIKKTLKINFEKHHSIEITLSLYLSLYKSIGINDSEKATNHHGN